MAGRRGGVRRAGVSAFGFGGTNFHAVLEEYVPGRHRDADAQPVLRRCRRRSRRRPRRGGASRRPPARRRCAAPSCSAAARRRRRGARLERLRGDAEAPAGRRRPGRPPTRRCAGAAVRVAIDYADAADLAGKAGKARQALRGRRNPAMWKMLRGPGRLPSAAAPGAEGRVPLHRPGLAVRQHAARPARSGSRSSPTTFAEADRIMTPLLGPAADRVHLRRRRRPGRPRSGSSSSCCRPRSPSRRCSPPTSR